jgi:hypothetical protein
MDQFQRFALIVGLIVLAILLFIGIFYFCSANEIKAIKTEPSFVTTPELFCFDDYYKYFVVTQKNGIIAYSEPKVDAQYSILLSPGTVFVYNGQERINTKHKGRWISYNVEEWWNKIDPKSLNLELPLEINTLWFPEESEYTNLPCSSP